VLKAELLGEARRQGFELAGIASATAAETRAAYQDWVGAGHAGEMYYLTRDLERRCDPRAVWPETGSILVVGLNYDTREPGREERIDPLRGRIARYALGDDYHEVLVAKLDAVLARAREAGGDEIQGRRYVDTGPLLERDLAARAGLGWFGKNTCILNRSQGSYFFLGALLLNVDLPPDGPTSAHCGTCSRCLDACPTGAFLAPYVLDARRCISYLTIELRGPMPRELRPLVGNWVFGCDICQEVCPWNRKSAEGTEERFAPRPGLETPELIPLLEMTQEAFSATFRGSPVKRAKRRGFLRNVCVALGNSGDPAAVPALVRALEHEETLVRGHAAWALGQLGGVEAERGLLRAIGREQDGWALEEMRAAMLLTADREILCTATS
jgi:epoxyqueuosine reductase